MNTTTRISTSVLCILLIATATACSGEGCEGLDYPTLDSGALFVAAGCGVGSEDGTAEAPYATIRAAAQAAGPGQVISVAPGTYRESVTLDRGVSLVGAGRDKVTIEPVDGVGITALGAEAVRISGLSVNKAMRVGILTGGTPVTMSGVGVSWTDRPFNDAGKPVGGHGVQVTGGAEVTIRGCIITDNEGVGVIADGAGQVSIIDPTFIIDPSYMPRSAEKAGIIDPTFSVGNETVISKNFSGGVAIIDPSYGPAGGKTDEAGAPALTIKGALLQGNRRFAIALYGAGASLQAVGVSDTMMETSKDDGHGLVLASRTTGGGSASVQIDDKSVLAGAEGAGVLMSTSGAGALTLDLRADVSGNRGGGAWVGGEGATLKVGAKASLVANHLLGMAVVSGARLEASGGRIEATVPKPWGKPASGMPVSMADGVGIFKGGTAALRDVKIASMQRAALIVVEGGSKNGSDIDLTVKGMQVSGSKYGLVVNKGGATASAALQEAVAASAGTSVDTPVKTDASEPVRLSTCDAADANADCKPTKPEPVPGG